MSEYEQQMMRGRETGGEKDLDFVIPRGRGRVMENRAAGGVSESAEPAVDILQNGGRCLVS
jgi:hypothetical protein